MNGEAVPIKFYLQKNDNIGVEEDLMNRFE